MNKIKKSLYICLLLYIFLLVGCRSEKCNYSEMIEKYNCIDSVVSYSIKAPLSTGQNEYKIFFNAPFYRVYSGENKDLDLLSTRDTFEIGDEAELEGENVEMLDGAKVTIYKTKLSECVNYDDYCLRMAYFYGIEDLHTGIEEGVDEDTLESIRNIVSNVADDYTVLTICITFDGCVYDNVTIDSLKIKSLNFKFVFEKFLISTFQYKDGIVENEDNNIVDYTAGLSGLFADAILPEIGYIEIMGDVKSDIKNIEVTSLDDDITVITSDNYSKYREMEDVYGTLYETNSNKYAKGDTISARHCYINNRSLDNVDTKMSNVLIRYTIEDGTKVCRFVYQPVVVDGPYLIMKKMDEYIK